MGCRMLPSLKRGLVVALLSVATVTLPWVARADDGFLSLLDSPRELSYNFDPVCYRCYNDADYNPDVPQDATLFLTSSGREVTCDDWAAFMLGLKDDDLINGRCLGYQFLTSYYCGCPEPPRPNCMLCPDGSQPGNLDGVVVTSDGEQSCRANVIFAVRTSFGEAVDSGRDVTCKLYQETGVGTCGCAAPEDADCKTLCPNGESVPDPDLVIFNDNVTCGDMERRLSVYAGGKCEAFQRSAGLSCGCQVDDLEREFEEDLLTEIGLCRVCGDGRPLLDPGALTMAAGENFTCAQIEIASVRDPARACGVARGFQTEDCCKEYAPSESPSERPTAPSARPSSAPTSAQTSGLPTSRPSLQPTVSPSAQPSAQPTAQPSSQPTSVPVPGPTPLPSMGPTIASAQLPPTSPTPNPSMRPTIPSVQLPPTGATPPPVTAVTTSSPVLATTGPTQLPSVGATTESPVFPPTDGETLSPTTDETGAPSDSITPSIIPTARGSSELPSSVATTLSPTQSSTVPETDEPTESLPPSNLPNPPPVTTEPSEPPSQFPSTDPSSQPTTTPTTPTTAQPTAQPTASSTTVSAAPSRSAPDGGINRSEPSAAPSSEPAGQDTTERGGITNVEQSTDDGGGGDAGLPPGIITLIVIGGIAAIVGTAYRVYTL